MSLVVETGAGLEDAESLVSVVEARAFAASRGLTLPTEDEALEAALRVAHDYLSALEDSLQGYRCTQGQALPFPRKGVVVYGYPILSDAIPTAIKNALVQLVAEGVDALPTAQGAVIVQETIGPISTTYAQSGVTTSRPSFPRVDNFLAPFKKSTGLRSIRV